MHAKLAAMSGYGEIIASQIYMETDMDNMFKESSSCYMYMYQENYKGDS